jgi:hypothetical protein
MEKTRVEGSRKYKGVGVMKDKEVNLEKIEDSHTLGSGRHDSVYPSGPH